MTSQTVIFQSTPPVWGATIRSRTSLCSLKLFQSTPPVRGATRMTPAVRRSAAFQSTPPMRGATGYKNVYRISGDISIHAPVRGATALTLVVVFATIFQSTPPVWGATGPTSILRHFYVNFNPRPPCGGRRVGPGTCAVVHYISIHAPRVGGDGTVSCQSLRRLLFQSTPPVWGATNTTSPKSSQ